MNRYRLVWGSVFLAICGSASVCAAQTQLVSDNFSGPNGSRLGSNWTGCGYNYGAYNQLVYMNNQAGGGGWWSQDCSLYTGYGVFPNDQYATATVVAPTPSSTTQAAVQLRGNATPSTPESYISCGWNAQDFPADYHYRIWSMGPNPATGGPTSLFLSTITPTTNDVITCQVLGNVVSMTLNGNTIAKVVDTSGIASGYPGMYYIDPNGSGPSSTDVIFSNFKAGSGPPVVSSTISPANASTLTGFFLQYKGTVTYADGTVAQLGNWTSSNPTAAPIDATGEMFAMAAANVTISGYSGTNKVTAPATITTDGTRTPLAYDTFVGNGTYLGSNWTGCGYDGGSYSKLVYQNNVAGGGGYWSQECADYTGYGAFPNDQFARARVVSSKPSSTPQAAVQLRDNATPSTPESYISCGWDALDFPADYHYRIWSMAPNPASGGPTSLYLSTTQTPAQNDLVFCQVVGSTVTMRVNGQIVATVNDTSRVSSGYPGLYYVDPNGDVPPPTDVIFDDFVAGRVN